MSINFRESPTNMPENKISRFLFLRQGHNVWLHPLQFPAWKWWPTVCIFNVEMIVRFPCLSKRVGRCQWKTAMPKGGELTPRMYSQLRRVDRRSQKISIVCSILRRQNRSTFWWICDSKALCSTHQQEHFGGKIELLGHFAVGYSFYILFYGDISICTWCIVELVEIIRNHT